MPLEPLLAASSAQQACQALQAPMPPAGAGSASSDEASSSAVPLGSRRYAHPLDGACPLTGVGGGCGEGSQCFPLGMCLRGTRCTHAMAHPSSRLVCHAEMCLTIPASALQHPCSSPALLNLCEGRCLPTPHCPARPAHPTGRSPQAARIHRSAHAPAVCGFLPQRRIWICGVPGSPGAYAMLLAPLAGWIGAGALRVATCRACQLITGCSLVPHPTWHP